MAYDQLKLKNQLCFPVYAASRLITREYQPLLDKLGITYPQYLVLMYLWEVGESPVNDIAKKLLLNTNTITPVLKRMEKQGLIRRERSASDERKVIVRLSESGKAIEHEAAKIPEQLGAQILSGSLDIEDIMQLKDNLTVLIDILSKKK